MSQNHKQTEALRAALTRLLKAIATEVYSHGAGFSSELLNAESQAQVALALPAEADAGAEDAKAELHHARTCAALAVGLLCEAREKFIHKHATYAVDNTKWNCVCCGKWGRDDKPHDPSCLVGRIDEALWFGPALSPDAIRTTTTPPTTPQSAKEK